MLFGEMVFLNDTYIYKELGYYFVRNMVKIGKGGGDSENSMALSLALLFIRENSCEWGVIINMPAITYNSM